MWYNPITIGKKFYKENYMKKFFALFLTIAMIATVFASVVVVNAADKLTITIDKAEAEAGTDVVVEIKLTNNTGINSLKMSLKYGDLTFKKATFPIFDADDEGMMRSSTNQADKKTVILNFVSADTTIEGDVTFAKVTFTVPEGAANGTVYALTADIDPEDVFVGLDTNVDFELVDGEVKVPGEPEQQVTPSFVGMSFDTFFLDGVSHMDLGWGADGEAAKKIADHPIDGDVQSLGARGWARIKDGVISQFGYRIDDEAPVYSDSFLQQRADVQQAFGVTADEANGFVVTADVSAVADGEHTMTVVVKATDGTVMDVVSFPFAITRPVVYSLLNVSYDGLYYDDTLLKEGSVDKWIYGLEDKSVLDFDKGAVKNVTVRGWARISENVADIAGFGYSIDGGEVVTGEFIEDRAAELANANFPGAQGFTIVVPVEDLEAGEHSIDAYLIAADGTQIKIVKDRSTGDVVDIRQVGVTFTVNAIPEGPEELAITVTSAAVDPGETFEVKVELSNVTLLASLKLKISWPEELELVDAVYDCRTGAEDENVLVHTSDDWTQETGSFVFNWMALDEESQLTEDQTFVTLTFKASETAEAGEYDITAEVDDDENVFYYEEGEEVDLDYNIQDGTVTINGEAPEDPVIINTCVDVETDDSENETLQVAGWTGSNYRVVKIGYTVDGGEPIYEDVEITELAEGDPVLNPENAGENGFRYTANIDYSKLSAGEHEIAIVILVDDENDTVLPIRDPFTVTVANNPDNPQTADVAIIAIAAVATIALAGAVIGKKALKK